MGFQEKDILSRSEKVDFVEYYQFLRQYHLNELKKIQQQNLTIE